MYTTGHMLRDEVIALHAFAAQCHGVQTMRVFNVYPNSKYTVVWGPRRYHLIFVDVLFVPRAFDRFVLEFDLSTFRTFRTF